MLGVFKLKFLRVAVLLAALTLSCPLATLSYDERPRQVTDELLRSLGLDKEYHACTHVADGDTLTLDGLGTVRFVGVDTPEKNHPMLPIQFMAQESSDFVRGLCLNRKIRLEYDPYDDDKRGKYGRILGYLYLDDSTFVQKALLKEGYAIAYTKYPLDEKKKERFFALERGARERGVNLWKENGMPEVRWILDQKQAVMQVGKASPSTWRLRFGDWSSEPVPHNEMGEKLSSLYSSIYSLSPRDLRQRLEQLGFHQGRPCAPTGETVTVIGMAHRNWGLVYAGFAHPRRSSETVGVDLQNLSRRMDPSESTELKAFLVKNYYYPFPGMPDASQIREIADGFLKPYRIQTTDQRVISWESAGKYTGKRLSVEGKIIRTHNSGKACYLNFHNNFTRYLSLVIFQEDFWKFPREPESYYLNKTILVRGKIEEYEGRPEIVLESPKQIQLLDKQG